MSDYPTSPQFQFSVAVNIDTGAFEYFDDFGQPCDGGVTAVDANTLIVYTLIANRRLLAFANPVISGDSGEDITVSLSPCKQQMTLIDANQVAEDISLRLVVTNCKTGVTYESPDPVIKNDPR